MPWLPAVVVACLAAAVVLWLRGMQVPGVLLAAAGFAALFLLGRGIEGRRDQAWQEVATRLQGRFRSAASCTELQRFGLPAPWAAWSRDGELQCPRAIEGERDGLPYALVQVRYSVRERRGEERPDAWYEVTVAALRLRSGTPAGALVPVNAPEGYAGAHNGESLFLWKKGAPGAGASLAPADLPALLEQARALAR